MLREYRRRIETYDITAVRPGPIFGIVGPEDFQLSADNMYKDVERTLFPTVYCIDPIQERILYSLVENDDKDTLMSAPFLYIAQRKLAKKILSVPLERVAEVDGIIAPKPIFIFSPGRTGSTLISKLFGALGWHSFSEPDIFTQLAVLPGQYRRRLEPGYPAILRAATASLARQYGSDIAVKLRSQCNAIAPIIASTTPKAKFIFLFRNVVDWAQSRHRAFGDSPMTAAAILQEAIRAYSQLVDLGADPVAISYDALVHDPCSALWPFQTDPNVSRDVFTSRISAIMEVDSQVGLPISRDATGLRDVEKDFVAAFQACWSAVQPIADIERHGLLRCLVK